MLVRVAPDAKIAFLNPAGWGNLGNSAIIESLIHAIRTRLPRADIVGFTLNPANTRARHGVAAHTCAAFSLPFYPVLDQGPDPGGLPAGIPQESGFRQLLRRIPVHGSLRTWGVLPFRMLREPSHVARSFEHLRGAAMLVVAGGGQLDALWGGAMGHPYALWKWGHLARRAGARYVFASVGTGTLTPASRWFVRRALRLAEYRSYRDEASRRLVGDEALTGGDPVVPDLAYALPVKPAPPPPGRRVVGISPMNFAHPGHWPEREIKRYRRHVASFGALIARLIAAGDEVVVFTTDRDDAAVHDTLAAAGPHPRLSVAQTPTLDALFATLARVHVVVAARLHGVLLPHVAHRPVLAVVHERKIRTLMEDTGQAHLCLDIDGFDPAAAELAVHALADSDEERARVAAYAAQCRGKVEAQYDALFAQDQRATSA